MTEAEWLAGYDPRAMLVHLCGTKRRRKHPSERKLRLFTVACARPVWADITDGEPLTAGRGKS